jgi:hypothetical protein
VVVIFVGNDLLEMQDQRRPHLDDELTERPLNAHPPPETTSRRRMVYNRCRPRLYGELFWQGINQAIYLHEHPEDYGLLLAKAERTVDLLAALCQAHDARLVIGLLPAYDDFIDYDLPFANDATMGPVLAERSNRRLRLDLRTMLQGKGIVHVDFHTVFREAEVADLYASDFHIWTAGHALVADALTGPVAEAARQTVGP